MNERDILANALKITDPAEREAYLARVCADNLQLREEVEALLHASAKDLGFDEPSGAATVGTASSPGADAAAEPESSPHTDAPGTVLGGKYRLIELIGEGGMGSVWYAEQRVPVHRKVAVKLIKPGRSSRGILARFDAERQALAVMDHPNIARVLDGGLTPDGRPFFVMELVRGVPITTFCDQRRLTPRERLELFIPVCRAIQHAHQKGIIHRDIKPSNILVALYDDVPIPKVIDFGVAKATGQKLTEMPLDTAFGAVVGTPTYMSPEQASLNQLDVDTRSDVYSLGVVLYELLVGSPPFPAKELKQAGLMEILRVIREDDPPRPSSKLSTDEASPSISANRKTEPRTLSGLLRNELDWVVMKALEKDRSRRYGTADSLGMDIQRYLAGEAVAAVPPSLSYRLRKFIRKHRGPVIAGSLIVLALLAGIGGTTWGMIDADQARIGESEQRKKVEDQRDTIIQAHRRADEALLASRTLSATLALDNGLAACARGDVTPGMLWFARALEIVPPEAPDLERAIRVNLGDWRHELHPLLFVLSHPDTVFAMDLAPGGKSLATGCGDKKARVWNLATGTLLYPPLEHPASLTHVRFSPNGRWLATADFAGNVRLWDAATGQARSGKIAVTTFVDGLAFSPDSEVLAVFDEGRSLHLWKTSTGDVLRQPIRVPGVRGLHIAFRPDGKFLVIANRTSTARIIDMVRFAPSGELTHARGIIEHVAFSADGKLCATVGTNPSGQLWDAATFKALPASYTHQDMAYRAVFSPDGSRLATCSHDQTARLWHTQSAQLIGLPMPIEGSSGSLAFSADGTRLITGSGGIAQLWDAATARPIGERLHQGSACTGVAMTVAPDQMIAAGWDGRVKVWRQAHTPHAGLVLTGNEGAGAARTVDSSGRLQDITSLAFSRDGKLLAAGDLSHGVHLWDVRAGRRIGPIQKVGHMVRSVAFSPDGTLLASGSDNDEALLWDTRTFKRQGKPLVHKGDVEKIIFHPRGDRMYTLADPIQAWDLATRQRVGPAIPRRDTAYDFALSHDGELLLLGDEKGAQLFNAATGKLVADLPHANAVLRVAFNRQRQALTCSHDKTATLWDAFGRRLQQVAHQSGLMAGAFSHKGDLVATAGTDRVALVWRTDRGEVILRLPHPGSVNDVAWGPEDRVLLTGCGDGKARLWDVATGRLLGRPQVHHVEVRCVALAPTGQMASGSKDGAVLMRSAPLPWLDSAHVIKRSIQRLTGMVMDTRSNGTNIMDFTPGSDE